ncbi:MAG: Gfo/Idh/MocA family oxidoreductase [candidate division WS1 bacterium]|jgi:predicted dehydrogenase|nr:Gfo/Idh/MocA family oxidoreductase [candidate division WS1 bacterium]
MSFKVAFLGCGGRANGHARVYDRITRGAPVACCDLVEEKAQAFAENYGIPKYYLDLDEMIEKEQPDLVHMSMPPTIRYSLMKRLSDHRIPAVIVEKPIAIGAHDYKLLRELEATSETRYTVNHQLRYHERVMEMLDHIAAGDIGAVRCLDASARLPMSGQGVHVLDLMFAFAQYTPIRAVHAACSGFDDINGTHPSPESVSALVTFVDEKRGVLQSGAGVPEMATDVGRHMHKRIAAYGETGFVHWTMHSWEKGIGGKVERGEHKYGEVDDIGQINLTNAVFDWIEDGAAATPTNLATSLDEWRVLLACYASTVGKTPIEFPFEPEDDLLEQYIEFAGAEWTNPHA